jgi:drug/metabolite transporter (DMT)-like permease
VQFRTRRSALIEGISAGVLFGTAAILIRFLSSTDAFTIAFWRLIIACFALSTILILFKKKLDLNTIRRNALQLMILGALLALHFVLFVSAVKDTTILNATVLVNTTPIFSVFISSSISKLKPSKPALASLMIAFAGASIIALADTSNSKNIVTPTTKGDAEAMLAALVESLYLNYGTNVRKQMDIISIMLPIYATAGLTIGLLSIPASNKTVVAFPISPQVILELVGLGLLPTAIAHTLYFSSLLNLKSFETATMALIEPIGATALGILVFQEIPRAPFVLGAALILVGVIFTVRNKS